MISLPISGINLPSLIIIFIFISIGSFGIPTGLPAIVSITSMVSSFWGVILAIIFVWAAAIVGDILAYEFARKFSFLREKLQKHNFYLRGEKKARKLLSKYEFFSVFITRFFLNGLCTVTSYVSGFEKLSRRKYILGVITGEFLFAIIYTSLGYIFKLVFDNLISAITNFAVTLTVLVLVIILIVITIKHLRNKHLQN